MDDKVSYSFCFTTMGVVTVLWFCCSDLAIAGSYGHRCCGKCMYGKMHKWISIFVLKYQIFSNSMTTKARCEDTCNTMGCAFRQNPSTLFFPLFLTVKTKRISSNLTKSIRCIWLGKKAPSCRFCCLWPFNRISLPNCIFDVTDYFWKVFKCLVHFHIYI